MKKPKNRDPHPKPPSEPTPPPHLPAPVETRQEEEIKDLRKSPLPKPC